jgi:flagellar biosynthetic protein FliQ
MEEGMALAGREAIWVALQIGAPLLGVMLIVGLVVSVFQALTQINEASLSFIPKVLGLVLTLMYVGPFIVGILRSYSGTLFQRIAAVGGAG